MEETSSGRGHHKRRKKGARSRFDRRKNEERRKLQDKKENVVQTARKSAGVDPGQPLRPLQLNPTTCERHHPNSAFENLKEDLIRVPLPEQWMVISDLDSVQYCQLKSDPSGVCQVTESVVVRTDCSWSVYVHALKVPATCKILADFQPTIAASSVVSKIVESVDRAAICPGSHEDEFISACQKKGGTIKGQRGNGETVAFIDEHPVVDSKGKGHSCTIRRVDCEILCEPSGRYPLRCRSCQSFRSTLRSSICRLNELDPTSASSHASYKSLSTAEKDERLRNVSHSLKISQQKVRRLKVKLESLIEKEGISLAEDDATDISAVFSEVNSTVDKNFPPDTPQRVFWDQQLKYNSLKNKKQMKWHPLVVRFALNLKYLSTSGYRAVRQSEIIHLPSERTLSDYTHWTSAHGGVQLEFIEHLKCTLEREIPSHEQRRCALSMDEMKIKSGLVFSKRTGSLVGFTDLGSANRDLERLAMDDSTDSIDGRLADQVFVFLARAVFKPSLAIPVAHYSSSNLSGETVTALAVK